MKKIIFKKPARCQWLTPIILTTQEEEIRKITVQSQPWQIVLKTLSKKKPVTKRGSGMAQGVGLEFKPQYCKKKKKERKRQHTTHLWFLEIILFSFSFYHFYIYSHVYTLFVTLLPSPLIPRFQAEPVPPSCSLIVLKRSIGDNKKDLSFLLV
jgi:hypothetical protein